MGFASFPYFFSLSTEGLLAEVQWDQECHWNPPRLITPCRKGQSSGIQSHCRWRKFLKLWRKDLSKDFSNIVICLTQSCCLSLCITVLSPSLNKCNDFPRRWLGTLYNKFHSLSDSLLADKELWCFCLFLVCNSSLKRQWQIKLCRGILHLLGSNWALPWGREAFRACRVTGRKSADQEETWMGWESQIWEVIGRMLLERELCGVALTQKTDLRPSLKVRVCPVRTQWEAGS